MSIKITYSFNPKTDEDLMKHLIHYLDVIGNNEELIEEIEFDSEHLDVDFILKHRFVLIGGDSITQEYQNEFIRRMLEKTQTSEKENEELIIIDTSHSSAYDWQSFNVDKVIYNSKDAFQELDNIGLNPEKPVVIYLIDAMNLYFDDPAKFESDIGILRDIPNVSIIACTGDYTTQVMAKNTLDLFTLRVLFFTASPDFSKLMVGDTEGFYLQNGNFVMYSDIDKTKTLYVWNEDKCNLFR